MSPFMDEDNKENLHQLIKLYNKNIIAGVVGVVTASTLLTYFYLESTNFILLICWYISLLVLAFSRYFFNTEFKI